MFIIVICAQNLTRWCITADIVGTAQRLTVLASVRIRGTLTLVLAAVLLAVLPLPPRNGEQVTDDERILNAFVKHWGLTLEEAREELAKAKADSKKKAERREAEKKSLWNTDKDWDYYPTYPEKKEQ
jgi:hypothetical protein